MIDAGGIAYLNAKTWPVGVVMNTNYQWYYAFGHEFSHILGAHHDRETLGSSQPPYSYGIGNRIAGTRKHTIMA